MSETSEIVAYCTSCFAKFNFFGHKILYFNILSIFGVTNSKMPFIIFLIIASSIYLSFKIRFANFTNFIPGVKSLLRGNKNKADNDIKKTEIGPIKAVFAVVAGATGLGSISGVAIAVVLGGPGAVFWILLTPFITTAVRMGEIILGHHYRQMINSHYEGGPSYYMKIGIGEELGFKKFGIALAYAFSLFSLFGAFGGGCAIQSNQSIQILTNSIGFLNGKTLITAFVFAVIVTLIILGGVKRVSGFLSKIIPIIVTIYFFACIVVIILHYQLLGAAMKAIFVGAFELKSVYGGILGAFTIGITRAVLTTEVGMGSAAIMHANVDDVSSARQGVIGMVAPVIQVIFICLMTGIVITITNVYNMDLQGIVMIKEAFGTVNSWFPYIITIMTPLMGLNVMVAWGFYGMRNCQYLLGQKSGKLFIAVFFLVAFSSGLIEDFGIIIGFVDVVNTAPIIPNIIALIMLSGVIKKELEGLDMKKLS